MSPNRIQNLLNTRRLFETVLNFNRIGKVYANNSCSIKSIRG